MAKSKRKKREWMAWALVCKRLGFDGTTFDKKTLLKYHGCPDCRVIKVKIVEVR